MADNEIHPVTRLRPVGGRPPSRIRALWSSLSDAVKVVLMLGSLVGLIGGAIAAASSLVTDGELATSVRAQDAVDTKQNAEIDALDAERELDFQVQVELKTDMGWVKQELAGVREDLRRMDRGLPLPALPTPHPTPVQTSAPTRAP